MGWIQDLYDTYESCSHGVGADAQDGERELMPIAHTTVMAHIEVTLDDDGTFLEARVVPKTEARTLIPCTETSAARTNAPDAHPLCDKLQYVAKDYYQMSGDKPKKGDQPFDLYTDLLGKWCESEFCHPKAKTVYQYIQSGMLIRDLLDAGLLNANVHGRIMTRAELKKEAVESLLVGVLPATSEPSDAVVRWRIYEGKRHETWRDQTLFEKWILFYESIQQHRGLCFVTGKQMPLAGMHPKKIRNDGDGAKLISFNDKDGFTFRGRFENPDEAHGISFEVTQKAHNALRWLISRQGFQRGDFACVVWEKTGKLLPDIYKDSDEILETNQNVGTAFAGMLNGYRMKLSINDRVVVMMLDSATPGRLSVTYYQTLNGSTILDRVEHWHDRCKWLHRYKSREIEAEGKKRNREHYSFIGAPSVYDMVAAAYGEKADDKLRDRGLKQLLTCILEDLPPAADMVHSAVRRASNPLAMESHEWHKTLSVTCAMYNGLYEKEEYTVALDTERTDRDYLFGRLLAVADHMELTVLKAQKEDRPPNAQRYMHIFSAKPAATWMTIYQSISPYFQKLGWWRREYYKDMVSGIVDMFLSGDFEKNTPLTGAYLLGYHSQLEWIKKDLFSRNDNKNNKSDDENGGNEK